MAMSSRTGIRLPPHTFYARGDEVIIIFPLEHWQGLLNQRGASPERKGYYFSREYEGDKILAIFNALESIGTDVRCDSSNIFSDAIYKFTSRHADIHVLPYHTHPINGPSQGDLESYLDIYSKAGGQIRDFITIGPQTVEINRVYPPTHTPRVQDIAKIDACGNPTTDWVKIVDTDTLGKEFHSILRECASGRRL